jgi:uncharacterized protein
MKITYSHIILARGLLIMIWELVIVCLVVLIGGIIQGATGFGFGLIVMGVLANLFTLKDSTLIVLSLILVTSLTIIIKLYKYIDVKPLLLIVSTALVGRTFSFFFLNSFGEMDFIKKWLGFFLIAMVLYILLSKKKTSTTKKVNFIIPIIVGLIGGFIGGVFAIGGPFFAVYFLMKYEDKYIYNANLQVSSFMTSSFTLTLHGINGDLNSTFFQYAFIGTISVLIGLFIGLKWFEKLPTERIKKVAMVIVIIAAIKTIFT